MLRMHGMLGMCGMFVGGVEGYKPVEDAGDVEGVGEGQAGHAGIDVVPLQHRKEGGQGHDAGACEKKKKRRKRVK
jgi:hypothetical protein